jgi:hypothetical protein
MLATMLSATRLAAHDTATAAAAIAAIAVTCYAAFWLAVRRHYLRGDLVGR